MAKRKGLFAWIIDKFKKLFGIKSKEEKEAEQAAREAMHSEAMNDAGILTAPSEEPERKSGSSPMVTVPVKSSREEAKAEERDFERESEVSEKER